MALTKITVEEAARVMQVTPQYIREGLKAQRIPIGTAVRMPGGRWSYCIYKEHLWAYLEKGLPADGQAV